MSNYISSSGIQFCIRLKGLKDWCLGSGRPKASQRTRAVRAKSGMIKPQSFNSAICFSLISWTIQDFTYIALTKQCFLNFRPFQICF